MVWWCSRQCADSPWKDANEGKSKSVYYYLRLHSNFMLIAEDSEQVPGCIHCQVHGPLNASEYGLLREAMFLLLSLCASEMPCSTIFPQTSVSLSCFSSLTQRLGLMYYRSMRMKMLTQKKMPKIGICTLKMS